MNAAVELLIVTLFAQGDCGGWLIHGKFFGSLNQSRLIEQHDSKNASELWITQPLDHFTSRDSRTWSQRYLKSIDYYKEGSPICIFVSGESKLDLTWVSVGTMVTQCSQMGAMIYSLEHRFFGESKPLADASVGSLRYLTTQQVLADLAAFIPYIKAKDNLGANTRTILYGGSYAATLVAYFKQKYSSITTVGVSSSGPVGWKYNFPEFHELSGKVIQLQSSTCHSTISSGIKELQAKLRAARCSSPTCPVDLSPLKVCAQLDVKNSEDIQTLYGAISSIFTYFVQYNGIFKYGIKHVCDNMDEVPSNKTEFEKLAETINRMSFHMENNCLVSSFGGFCRYMRPQGWTSDGVSSGARMWWWLVCNEFASFQTTSTSSTYPFVMQVLSSFYASQCQCAFGKQYTESFIKSAVQKTQNNYGGVETITSGVAYVNGQYDPWSAIGVTDSSALSLDSNKSQNLVLTVAGGSHCNDMLPARASDSISLLKTRSKLFEFINNPTARQSY